MEQNGQNGLPARQRAVRTEEQIQGILGEYDGSGFTVKEFCEVSEINEATFYSWLKKYRPKAEGEGLKGFAAIEVTPMQVPAKPELFAEIGAIKLYKEVPAEYIKTLLS